MQRRSDTSTRRRKRHRELLLLSVLIAIVLAAAACTAGANTPIASDAETPTTGPSPYGPLGRPHATGDPTVVMTDRGPIRGTDVGFVRKFVGVPYAAPPVGDLRWRNPRPPEPWYDLRDATRPSALCAQGYGDGSSPPGSEDCLYLSVHTPLALAPDAPTMVWFHGGGFTLGSPSFTDPSTLAARTGAIVVSPAYRLGPFGFAATDEFAVEDEHGSSGSYGLADQRLALQWVRDNIAAFGGNPRNVTIFGESAGGWSVCAHLVSPASRGLFHKAIVQSGPCAMPLVSRERSRRQGAELATAIGCAPGGRVDVVCMRARPSDMVLAALPTDGVFGLNDGVQWSPTVDGWMLDQPVLDAMKAGKAADVPLLLGWNTDEGRLFHVPSYVPSGKPFDGDAFHDVLLAFAAGDAATAAQIEERYPYWNYRSPRDAFLNLLGDAALKCPGRAVAVELANRGHPVFLYSFAYRDASFQIPIPTEDTAEELGAYHSAELQFVFDAPLKPDDAAEQSLANEMSTRWVQFAKTGSPNGGFLSPVWPAFTASPNGAHIVFDETVTTGTGLDERVCNFWDSLAYRWARH